MRQEGLLAAKRTSFPCPALSNTFKCWLHKRGMAKALPGIITELSVSTDYEGAISAHASLTRWRVRDGKLVLNMKTPAGLLQRTWLQSFKPMRMGREHYRLYRTGEEFDDATWKDFRARSRELRGAVLALADAIAQAVLVDKAARATECDLWPALAFFNLNAFVLIGEWLVGGNGAVQAAIIIKWTPSRTTRRVRGPAPDVTILSAPPEWSACHHAHGAAPNAERVAQMVSSVFYNGELQTSRATADQTRELVRQINLLNRRTLSRSGQMLFLVKDSIDHHDAQQLSRLAHRSVAAALVIRLLSQQVAESTILVTP
ncbi:hypothetical protein CNMCM7691_007313 [Aspergillus felis]|uniref:Uncharacterized protein n=1 Tax=Aspergillus felis TaxID=1287682 RepID=A0A8H6V1L2_9EURO|nr:hypothetical protein CNMCM7691_007313 [Aspergillus felis]